MPGKSGRYELSVVKSPEEKTADSVQGVDDTAESQPPPLKSTDSYTESSDVKGDADIEGSVEKEDAETTLRLAGNGHANEAMIMPSEDEAGNEAGTPEKEKSQENVKTDMNVNVLHAGMEEKTGEEESFTVDCEVDHLRQASRNPTMRTTRQILQTLDYTKEVRAKQELLSFVKGAELMMDMEEDGPLEDLLDPLLSKLVAHEHKVSLAEAKQALFADGYPYFPTNSVQSFNSVGNNGMQYVFDESWIALSAGIQSLRHRRIGIVRLQKPVNMGLHRSSVRFVFLVISPSAEKGIKSARTTSHQAGSLFSNAEFRAKLGDVTDVETFRQALIERAEIVTSENLEKADAHHHHVAGLDDVRFCDFGSGVYRDLKRRLPHYWSDFKDGVTASNGFIGGFGTFRRLSSAILFLYFTCLFYTLALGDLYYKNTHGYIGVSEAIIGSAIVGIAFSLFGGQPMSIILTTAPLALYTKVIYKVSKRHHVSFTEMYFAVGCWTAFFLIVFSLLNASRLMKWATRSIDEILDLFVAASLLKESVLDIHGEFEKHYSCENAGSSSDGVPLHGDVSPAPSDGTTEEVLATVTTSPLLLNVSTLGSELLSTLGGDYGSNAYSEYGGDQIGCSPETSILFIMLVLMTTWLGIALFRLKDSPFLPPWIRQTLSDQALGITVIIFSFIASYCFRAVPLPTWEYTEGEIFHVPKFGSMGYTFWFGASGMALPLSLLLFLENNLTSLTVNSPANKLKKGTAYHWNLFFIAILNFVMSLFGFPMVHAVVPHSPMHVRILADTEERVEFGYLHTLIVKVRETRLSSLIASIGVAVSLLMLPTPLTFIPKPVLTGVWVYLALQTFVGNQFFERMTLVFTEKSAYPTNHYVRRVPERTMHLFTLIEVVQLVVLSVFGLSSNIYMKMAFPLILLLYIPFRQLVLPLIIKKEYLKWIDSH